MGRAFEDDESIRMKIEGCTMPGGVMGDVVRVGRCGRCRIVETARLALVERSRLMMGY